MAPALTAQQKALTAQFRELTGASDRSAARYLKNANYKMNEAVDAYYGGSNAGSGAGTPSPTDTELNKIFDALRGKDDPADSLATDSTIAYLSEKLDVNLENAELFVAMEIVQAPAVGQITRTGFVEGWKAANAPLSINDQAKYIKTQSSQLSSDLALFKKVYRYAFVAAKEPDQKAISLEHAFIYWDTLFSSPGWKWTSTNYKWLELWQEFLKAKWTRSVNKDMWNQTLEFAFKAAEDETLSFWNEDGAWPSVIDDFVSWCREEKGIKPEAMDTGA